MIRATYHVTALGRLASRNLRPDLDGYVHLTPEAVLSGRWDADDDDLAARADEIAATNRAETETSEHAIATWRETEQ